jgi:hypothetical protein
MSGTTTKRKKPKPIKLPGRWQEPILLGSWDSTRGVWQTETTDLLSEHSEPFSATWPVSGMTRDGLAFVLPMPVLPTVDSGSSSSPILGTPRTSSANGVGDWQNNPRGTRGRLEGQVDELLKTPTAQLAVNGGSQHPDKRKEGGHGPTLADEVEHLLPTPQAHDAVDGKTAEQVAAMRARTGAGVWNLNEVAANELALLPTPTTAAATGGNARRGGERSEELLLPGIAAAASSGALLPTPTTDPDTGNGHARDLRS